MFLFFSILAASIDGFVSGVLIAAAGLKFSSRDFFRSLAVIFSCCLAAAFWGNILEMAGSGKYINIAGATVMFFLAVNSITGETADENCSNIYAVSLAVAADAAIVCIYLAAAGYSLLQISILSAFLHSALMATGAVISHRIIHDKRQLYTRYIAAAIFIVMALCKLTEI